MYRYIADLGRLSGSVIVDFVFVVYVPERLSLSSSSGGRLDV